jgi:membrane protein required for colicin V production
MNALDILIIIIFAFCIIRGVFQGLLRGVSSLVAILVGLFLAKRYYLATTALLTKIHVPDANGIIGYIFVFLIFFMGVKIIFFLLAKVTESAGLSILDRVLGSGLGFIKGALYCLLLIFILQAVLPQGSVIFTHSKIMPYYKKGMASAKSLMPPDIHIRPSVGVKGHT